MDAAIYVAMGRQVLEIAVEAMTYPLDLFYELLGRSQTLGIYWAFFLLAVVYRLLVAPLIGSRMRSGSSDTARRKRTNANEDD